MSIILIEIVYHVYNAHEKHSHHIDKKLVVCVRVVAVAGAFLQMCFRSMRMIQIISFISIRYNFRDPISNQLNLVDESVFHNSISNVINQLE